jgi:cyclin B
MNEIDIIAENIDINDADNQFLCSEYVNDIYNMFWRQEKEFQVNSNYMAQHTLINERMRCILVDWLVDVHLKLRMVPETIYLTVNILDRYLQQNHQVRRSKLQLVGVASILLAAKYEEISPPQPSEFVWMCDNAYTVKEILEMETTVCIALQFNLTVPTPLTFLCRYLKAAYANRAMVQMSCYLTERCLQEYSMQKFLPSVIAATAIRACLMSLKRPSWSPTLTKYTTYDESELKECSDAMRAFIHNPSLTHTAVWRKYANQRFGSIARKPIIV